MLEQALKAQSLWERLAVMPPVATHSPDENKAVEGLLLKWKRSVAGSKAPIFQRRLAWDGYSLAEIKRALQAEPIPLNTAACAWVSAFEEIMGRSAEEMAAIYTRLGQSKPDVAIQGQKPRPFDQLFVPFLQYARRALYQDGGWREVLSSTASVKLERLLLNRLIRININILFQAFTRFKAGRQGGVEAALLSDPPEAVTDHHYRAFLQELQGGLFYTLMASYPVAARLCIQVVTFWIAAQRTFMQRLVADWSVLHACVGHPTPFHQVTDIKGGLSDPHNGGQSVLILTFDERFKVVYKPRPLDLEQYFARFKQWINDQGGLLPLRLLRHISRATYGWLEFVEPTPCTTIDEVQRYYQRFGMLLCMVYAVKGTDLHKENIIASGEHPVLIDMESMLCPSFSMLDRTVPAQDAILWARVKRRESVMATSMLPSFQFSDKGGTVNIGALGEAAADDVGQQRSVWMDVNTDAMRVVARPADVPQINLPHLHGQVVPPRKWVGALVEGFEHTYHVLMNARSQLLATDSFLFEGGRHWGRFLFRNTSLYGKMLVNSCTARYLHCGVARSIFFDGLSRALVHMEACPKAWPMIREEQKALEQLDIPFFSTQSNSQDIFLSNGAVVRNVFDTSALEAVRVRLAGLDAADLAFQVRIIRESIYAHPARGLTPAFGSANTSCKAHKTISFSPALAWDEAAKIGAEIVAHAYHAPSGEAIWFGANYVPEARRYAVDVLDASLSHGVGGVAIFLSALAKVHPRFRPLALQTVDTLQCYLKSFAHLAQAERGQKYGVSQCSALVYAFTHVAVHLGDTTLLAAAKKAASLLTERMLAKRTGDGILGGTAGLILSLLALYKVAKDVVWLDWAKKAGNQLLTDRRLDPGSGLKVWHTCHDRVEDGFAQGVAGIAHALFQLYHVSRDSRYRDAAHDGLKYIWQGRSLAAASDDTLAWSHGLAGMGMTALGAPYFLEDPEARIELVELLQVLHMRSPATYDGLAVGTLGHVDLLLTAATRLGHPHLRDAARSVTAQVIAKAHSTGSYALGTRGHAPVGFASGLSGIGYMLLRLVYPEAYPSLLYMAAPRYT